MNHYGVEPLPGLPSSVTICEVGPRDGLQNEAGRVPTEVKVEFIERLVAAGHTVVETASMAHPNRVPQLADAEDVLRRLDRRPGVRYPVLVPDRRGLDRAMDLGVTDIAVPGSGTESFAAATLDRTISESLEMVAPVVARAREAGLRVRGQLSMCWGDPWEGHVPIPQVVSVADRLIALGCTEIGLGDTIGVATSGRVVALLDALLATGIPIDRIAVRFHDTYGQGLANTLAALHRGITSVDASAGGLGGCPYTGSTAGNLATEDLVRQLDGLGIRTGIALATLVEISAWLAGCLGRPSPARIARPRPRSRQSG